MITNIDIISKINNLKNTIESINSDIKLIDFYFDFPITNKINLSDSILYFISYTNSNLLILYFTIYEPLNLLKLDVLDYPELTTEFCQIDKLDFEFDNKLIVKKLNVFIEKIISLSKNIIYNNLLIKKNFSTIQLYPTLNKVYLKSNFYKKYCLILIKEDYFMITFNDENENYIRVDNFNLLLDSKQLKIFKKFLFI